MDPRPPPAYEHVSAIRWHVGTGTARTALFASTEEEVTAIVRALANEQGLKLRFFCFAPVWGQPPGYHLLMEFAQGEPGPEQARHICQEFERRLTAANSEYERKRRQSRRLPDPRREVVPY